jgi:hypothetical protein
MRAVLLWQGVADMSSIERTAHRKAKHGAKKFSLFFLSYELQKLLPNQNTSSFIEFNDVRKNQISDFRVEGPTTAKKFVSHLSNALGQSCHPITLA